MVSIKNIEIRYNDIDQMGVVFHSHYVTYLMQARIKFYEDAGFNYNETEESGIIFPVRNVDITYLKPIRLTDKIHIKTTVHALTKVKVTYYHEIYNDREELLAKAYTTVVSVDRYTFKTVRMNERMSEVYRVYQDIVNRKNEGLK